LDGWIFFTPSFGFKTIIFSCKINLWLNFPIPSRKLFNAFWTFLCPKMKREFSLRLSLSPTFLWCLSELGKVGKETSCFKQRLAETDCHSSIEPRSKIARP
jgi:hypothetical protein